MDCSCYTNAETDDETDKDEQDGDLDNVASSLRHARPASTASFIPLSCLQHHLLLHAIGPSIRRAHTLALDVYQPCLAGSCLGLLLR